jgi:LysR family transcriptional regulator of gallate degradation
LFIDPPFRKTFPMSSINLRHVRAFHSVATTGGIRRSAEALYRASSAVARSVSALEQSLDVPLFERKGRGMLLTAAGETVRLRAARIDAELNEVRDDAVRMLGRGDSGGAIGAIDALFYQPRLLAASLLAEVHHMPSVARATGMSQPAVSSAIAKLEATLRQPLFMRTASGMVPTVAGARWVVRFERVLAELRHIEADIAALNGVLEGVVTIGALPLARTLVLPVSVAALLHRHPRMQVRSLESPYEDLCAGLLSGKIDFIVGALRPLPDEGLATELLFGDDIALIAGSTHPLASRRSIGLRDLDGFPWVLSRAGTPLRRSFEAFFARHGMPAPQPAIETGDLALLRGLLLQGGMLTALSAHQLRYEIEAGSLVVLPFAMAGMRREIGITTRAGAHLSSGATALLDEIRRVGAEVAAAERPGAAARKS